VFVFILFVFILCTLCGQVLWIVQFWLPLRYSLTFIYIFWSTWHFVSSWLNLGTENKQLMLVVLWTLQIPCARKRQILFCKTPLWFYQKVLWNWYLQHARGFDWQHIFYVWRTFVSTDSRHTYGYKLCSSSRRLVPLFVCCRLHTGASQEKRKEASPIFNFTFRYIDDVLSLNNSRFGDFVDRIYPIELEIKDTTYTDSFASYLDLDLEIDSEGRLKGY